MRNPLLSPGCWQWADPHFQIREPRHHMRGGTAQPHAMTAARPGVQAEAGSLQEYTDMKVEIQHLGDLWAVCRMVEVPLTFRPGPSVEAKADVDTLRIQFPNNPRGRRRAAIAGSLVLARCNRVQVLDLGPDGAVIQFKPTRRAMHRAVLRLAERLGLRRIVVPRKEHNIPVHEDDDWWPVRPSIN